MNSNRGKSVADMIVEREAERAYQRALLTLPDSQDVRHVIAASRKRATALGNAIAKRNSESDHA